MEQLLKDACKELKIEITEKQINQFIKYKDLLLDWNNKINLTAITDENEIALKHFIDSISICKEINLYDKKIIDIGTGAGFPGIPIKIAFPNSKITLLDSLNKRINFLNEVISQLSLDNISCIHSRAEDLGRNEDFREKFDICVSRAVADLSVLSEYCLPFVSIGGFFISFKGPNIDEEINNSKNAINQLGGEIEAIKTVNIPFTDIKHTFVLIKKLRHISSKYPRKSNKILKSPIA